MGQRLTMQRTASLGRHVARRLRVGRDSEPGTVEALLARHHVQEISGIRAAVVTFDGATYYVPVSSAHRPVARKVLNKRYVEPRLHRLVEGIMNRRPGSILHAGAYFGDMLPSFSRKTTGTVYAFEPVLEHYLLARAATEANHLANVRLLRAGLSGQPGLGSVRTQRNDRHIGGAASLISGEVKEEDRAEDVAVLTIDQLDIKDLSIIQLDVEGWELPVLRGAATAIREQQPVIVLEDNRDECGGFLGRLGYIKVAQLDRDYVYMTAQADMDMGDFVRM